MSADCEDDRSSYDSNLTFSNRVEYARLTCGKENSYYMKTETITIGRNSSDGLVDIDVGPQTFISRKHLEVIYSLRRLKVKCLGKNGIFIDNFFKAHSPIAYELPQECTLRFPSTNVEVMVQQLAGRCVADKRDDVDGIKKNIFKSGLYECMDYNEEKTRMDVYVSNSVDKSSNTEIEESREMTPQRDIYSKSRPRKSVSCVYMEPVKVQKMMEVTKTPSLPQIIVNPRSYHSYSCTTDFIYGHNSQIFGTPMDPKDLAIDYGTETQKPPYSYAQLIVQAVSTCPDRQLTLNGIYNYISKHYPYFKSHDKGWQNSVRHNLSLNRYFIKVPRAQDEPGKGSFWRIDAAYESKLITQAFRKRRLRTNACVTNEGPSSLQGSRMFSLGVPRPNNICTFSDRTTKLGTFYALKRNDHHHKTAFVLKKMNDTKTVSQGVISVLNNNSQIFNVDKKISVLSPNSVFHSRQHDLKPIARPGQKRLYPSSIHVINDSTTSSSTTQGGTLFNIDGNLYSTNNDLKSIQVLTPTSTTNDNNSISFLPLKKPQSSSNNNNNNKYILISTSKTKSVSSSSPPPSSVCITGSGSLYRSTTTIHVNNTTLSNNNNNNGEASKGNNIVSLKSHLRRQSTSPLSHCSSDIAPPLSPSLHFTHSLENCHHDNDNDDIQDDELDFEMDQFLVSSPIMDHTAEELDTSPDLYNVDADNDDVMWQDSLGFHDVEIEGH